MGLQLPISCEEEHLSSTASVLDSSEKKRSKKRKKTPSFILELPLVVELYQEHILAKRFECARQLYNAVLGEGLRRLRRMQQSKRYQEARRMKKGTKRTALFQQLRGEFGFQDYALHKYLNTFHGSWVWRQLDGDVAQKLSTRAFQALNDYALGKKGRPRFKGKNQLSSVEGKSKNSALKFRDFHCIWGKRLRLQARFAWEDELVMHGLDCRIKYTRLVRRVIHKKTRYFVQLVLEGKPKIKEKHKPYLGTGCVGIDIGPSTIAAVAETNALLELFCHALDDISGLVRVLQRKLERQRRANNPKNYLPDGKIRPGKKSWKRSNKMDKTQAMLAEEHRRLAAHRKCLHNELINRLLEMGDQFQLEKLSYRSFQKHFGRSVAFRAPGMFVSRLKRKAESAGASVREFSTYRTALSQRCHCGKKQKKPLGQRVHHCECGVRAQRDLYSAFLARFVERNKLQVSKAAKAWKETEAFLSVTWKQAKAASGGRRVSSFGSP